MTGTKVIIDLFGSVALLLWGLHMVRSSIIQAYGGSLRASLRNFLDNRCKAFVGGLGITLLLQSSTATALLASSFITSVPALGLLLGADVGTALVAQVLSFKPFWLSPMLLFTGFVMFSQLSRERDKQWGMFCIGLGLMLLALQLILSASGPMRDSDIAQGVLAALASDPILAVLVAAIFTYMAHSSLAIILLVVSLAGTGVLGVPVALTLVLGANLGGALPAVMATMNKTPEVRRPPIGNFLFRLFGCILVLPWLGQVELLLPLIELDAGRQIVNFHLLFNLVLVAVALPLVHLMAQLTEALLPAELNDEQEFKPRHLDAAALEVPALALSNVVREILRMGDTLESMISSTLDALKNEDQNLVQQMKKSDDLIDDFHEKIHLYLTQLSRESLNEKDSRRCNEIMAFATNLEHVGDIIERSLALLIAKKNQQQLHFSTGDKEEIKQLYLCVQTNMKLAFSVFLSGDLNSARHLLEQKTEVRDLEHGAVNRHQKRLREQDHHDINVSALYLDILRDLKKINSCLVSVAYPILDHAGELRDSRLRVSHS
ncbi:MAG: Na/Pi cotransporter family protein [Gammaproteobacteria bacterium]|nr:Na/Pi cotransporter family protein [Gammaproteobacteria bacterium]